MSTQERTRKETPKQAARRQQRERVAAFLEHYDRYLFGEKATIRKAKQLMKSQLVPWDGVSIGKLAKEVCTFWRNEEYEGRARRKARGGRFDSNGWYAQQAWIRSHMSEIDEERDTPSSVARRMQFAGILTNAHGAYESLASFGMKLASTPKAFKTEASAV